jgi:urease beta subunit
MAWVEVDTTGVGIVTGVEIVTNLGRNGPQTMIINNGNRPIEIVNEHRHGNHQMIITTEIITGIVKDGCHQGVNFVSLPYV